MQETKIEWTNRSWNPICWWNLLTNCCIWFCTHASGGCLHCYAEALSRRFGGASFLEFKTQNERHVEPRLKEDELASPLRLKEPQKIFVCDMTDLFHPLVPQTMIYQVSLAMLRANWHTYQVLTKRAERMANVWLSSLHCEWLREALRNDCLSDANIRAMFDHVWLGVSVEDQPTADARIPWLLKVPARRRFLSVEPLLKAVDLTCVGPGAHDGSGRYVVNALTGEEPFYREDSGEVDATWTGSVHWIICGGESGPSARPMHPDWARSLRDQCQQAGTPFFFKQWGEFAPVIDSTGAVRSEGVGACGAVLRVGKRAAGRLLDGRTWDEFPEVEVCQ